MLLDEAPPPVLQKRQVCPRLPCRSEECRSFSESGCGNGMITKEKSDRSARQKLPPCARGGSYAFTSQAMCAILVVDWQPGRSNQSCAIHPSLLRVAHCSWGLCVFERVYVCRHSTHTHCAGIKASRCYSARIARCTYCYAYRVRYSELVCAVRGGSAWGGRNVFECLRKSSLFVPRIRPAPTLRRSMNVFSYQ